MTKKERVLCMLKRIAVQIKTLKDNVSDFQMDENIEDYVLKRLIPIDDDLEYEITWLEQQEELNICDKKTDSELTNMMRCNYE